MHKFILASGNSHKAEEFQELFVDSNVQVFAAEKKLDVPETGTTYLENAFQKAKAYFEKYQTPVLSDDSGLNVEALPEELGIHSARFGGEGLTDKNRANLLLEKMKNIPKERRSAYFTCVLCFYLSEDEVFYFEGRVKGKIGHKYVGDTGFGYDPVFIPEAFEAEGKTMAEVSEWKNLNSHRASASKHAIKFFKERICQSK